MIATGYGEGGTESDCFMCMGFPSGGHKNVLELESGSWCIMSLIVNFMVYVFYHNKSFTNLLKLIVHQALYTCFISYLLPYEAGDSTSFYT